MAICLFNDNKSAVEHFIQSFKSPNCIPSKEQLELIFQFHKTALYRSEVTIEFVKKFILLRKAPMIEKQFLASWLHEIYGLNLSSVTTCSISPPALHSSDSVLQQKFFAILSLFYNLSPLEITEIQLFSMAYLKPYF